MLDIEPTFGQLGTSGVEVDTVVQVEGAVIDMAFCVLGNTCLEFLQYREPEGQEFRLRNCDIGAVHICFEVEDIEATYQHLVSKGVEFSAPPAVIADGPLQGIAFAYFRDLQGLQLELFQVPEGSPATAQ
jgi:catechol 2,3-dioxygenase-like lactoylglutathione lyase family enzyme